VRLVARRRRGLGALVREPPPAEFAHEFPDWPARAKGRLAGGFLAGLRYPA
jgi:hypothetical protein